MDPELANTLSDEGYSPIRMLPDGRVIGVRKMMFTFGLFVGLDARGYSHRYCYESRNDALRALETWNGEVHPSGPWIVRKGIGEDIQGPGSVDV